METVIQTNYGPVKGIIKKSLLEDEYFAFQGIPYAKPPIDELRFKAPLPCESWIKILDATQEKSVPYHVETHIADLQKSEDCLYLNIYSKHIKPDSPLPVMIFIYGGAFHSGSSSTKQYGPDFFMQKDVLLVTFNYRLGPLGFLNFTDPTLDIPGNAGLKDQVLLLKWVKENIEYFGGDSNNITIFGDSAGAVSVGHHLLYNISEGLFQKAILMSGSPFFPHCFLKSDNDMSKRLAKVTGWNEEGGEKAALKHLKNVDPEKLMTESTKILTMEDIDQDINFAFAPTLEPYRSDNCFIDKFPEDALKNAWSKNVDIIIGYTSNEAIMLSALAQNPGYKNGGNPSLVVPFASRNGKSKETCNDYEKKIRDLYDLHNLSESNLKPFFELINDKAFVHGIHQYILSRVNDSEIRGKTFAYRFCYEFAERNHHKKLFKGEHFNGACHGDDLSYIFTNIFGPLPIKGTTEWEAIQKVRNMFVDFATKGSEGLVKLGWEDVKKCDLPYNYKSMEINNEWKMIKAPELSRLQVLNSILDEM